MNAYAGGPDFNMKQQQVQQVYKEHEPVSNASIKELKSIIEIREPDWLDQIYVWARVNIQIPSWVIFGIFIFGLVTIIGHKFRKSIKAWLRGVLSE